MSKSKKLSILFYEDGFYFTVFKNDIVTHSEMVLYSSQSTDLKEKIDTAVAQNIYWKQEYQEVYIAVLTNDFALVPNKYFNQEEPYNWLKFSCKEAQNFKIKSIPILNADAALVYGIPTHWEEILTEYFPHAQFRNASEKFINSIEEIEAGENIFVNLHPYCLEIIAYREQDLVFYNTFATQSREDILYYVLNTLKQLNFDPNQVKLYYFGYREKDEDKIKMLMNFVQHVMPGVSDFEHLSHYSHIEISR